jgi:hypothetical protein
LLCTAILRELRRRRSRNVWMMSRNPGLYSNSLDVDRVVQIDIHQMELLRRLGTKVTIPHCFTGTPDGRRLIPPPRPVIPHMCAMAGITGIVSVRPWLYLTEEERARGRFAERQVVMHSSGRSANYAISNKEWLPGRFQEVATALIGRKYHVIQVGSPLDPPLAGARDLRGLTSLRESAALIANSHVVICQEGFLMHLARAVDTRAVVIYGGAADPAFFGYAANEHLTSTVPCAVCWLTNDCPQEHICMTEITAGPVVAAAERLALRYGEPLPLSEFSL